MMIRIHERDIYEAFHLVSKVKDEPELRIIMKFIEGVIESDGYEIISAYNGVVGESSANGKWFYIVRVD